VLFMNDKERRIVIHDVKTKALDTMAKNASTAPYRIPGKKNAVTFVGEGKTLLRLDVKERRVTTLATIPFKTGGHHVWTSRGTILIASGPMVYEWNPAKPDEWKTVWRSFHPDLQGITRIALSPKGDRIAFVSTPRDATIIRDSRAASNRLLAEHRADAVAQFLRKDAIVIASNGNRFDGREAIENSLAERFALRKGIVYVRTPDVIEISKSGDVASERGTWTGTWEKGAIRGNYMAVWQREIGESGTPAWTIRSEQFVALECDGGGCS
jgi:ketosteroid isomerase-like protein